MNEKLRVLMVHNFYQIGGGEHTVFANEVELLRKNGHTVVEYTRSNDELKSSKLKTLLTPLSTLWSLKTHREVKRIIKEEKIDVVHCHNTFPLISPSVYYAARSRRVPVFQTVHNFRFLCPAGTFFCDGSACERCREQGNFKEALRRRCYRRSKVQTLVVVAMLKLHRLLKTYNKINYIFLTEFNKSRFDRLIDINGKNVFIKPNFVEKPADFRRELSEKKFVFAGRLDENKGIKLLLERWKALPGDYKLHIYGEGECEQLVREAAEKYPNIEFYGFVEREQIAADIKDAFGLVFPSILYEGFPMIISESMSYGCPVLCADLGNHGSIVRESQAGTLFDPKSQESFNKAAELIVSDNDRLSKNALKYYDAVLDPQSNYETLMRIYTDPGAVRGK